VTQTTLDPRSVYLGRHRHGALAAILGCVVFATPACVASTVVAHPVALGTDSARVVTRAAKAQLVDGSIVTLPQGFRVDEGHLVGSGWRFAPTLRDSVPFSAISTDSITGVVTFRTAIDPAKSVGMSAAAGVTLAFLLGIAFVAACAATSCLRD